MLFGKNGYYLFSHYSIVFFILVIDGGLKANAPLKMDKDSEIYI